MNKRGLYQPPTCPACGDVVTVDESILSLGKIECPGCGNILEFDLGGGEE